MADDLQNAPDVARDLGVKAKALRDWLRSTYPRRDDERGERWCLTAEMVVAAKAHFDQR